MNKQRTGRGNYLKSFFYCSCSLLCLLFSAPNASSANEDFSGQAESVPSSNMPSDSFVEQEMHTQQTADSEDSLALPAVAQESESDYEIPAWMQEDEDFQNAAGERTSYNVREDKIVSPVGLNECVRGVCMKAVADFGGVLTMGRIITDPYSSRRRASEQVFNACISMDRVKRYCSGEQLPPLENGQNTIWDGSEFPQDVQDLLAN